MPFPFDLVVFSDVPEWIAHPEAGAALRKLANRMPLAFVSAEHDGEELRRLAAQADGAVISLFVGQDHGHESGLWSAVSQASRLPETRLLHVGAARSVTSRAAETGGLRSMTMESSLDEVVDGILAQETDYQYDESWASLDLERDYLLGIRFFNRREYYEAHEAWELAWNLDHGGDGPFYRSLIQFAVGTLHWERGNDRGARILYDEARGLMIPFVPEHLGLDVVDFLQMMEDYFEPLLEAQKAGRPVPAPHVEEPPIIEIEVGKDARRLRP